MNSIEENNSLLDKTRILNRNTLKYSIIVLMLVDHLCHEASAIYGYTGFWYVFGRMISRLTATVMCYMLAEGFRYTRSVKNYIKRLGIFALISHLPFVFFETGQWAPVKTFSGNVAVKGASFFYLSGSDKTVAIYSTSMIFTLFLGILTLAMWEKTKLGKGVKIALTVAVCYLATFGDWSFWAILYILSFYFLRNKPVFMWGSYVLVSLLYVFAIDLVNGPFPIEFTPGFYLYRLGTLLTPFVILLLYNGKPGKKSAFNKWFFYVFYPLHLLILGLLFN